MYSGRQEGHEGVGDLDYPFISAFLYRCFCTTSDPILDWLSNAGIKSQNLNVSVSAGFAGQKTFKEFTISAMSLPFALAPPPVQRRQVHVPSFLKASVIAFI